MRGPMKSTPATAPIPNATHALTITCPLSCFGDSLVLKQIWHHPLGALRVVSIPGVTVNEKPLLCEDPDQRPDQQQHPGSQWHERKIGQDSRPAEYACGRVDRVPDEAIR